MKMYILVCNDLGKSQQGVQGGHALAQFALDHPERFREWGNRTIVYLKADYEWLKSHVPENEFSAFYEPYWGNRLTAIATYCHGNNYKQLELM